MVKTGLGKCLLICGSLASVSMVATPARALDDGKGNSLLDAFSFFGLGNKEDDKVVLYRERPPLVLPPKAELRQPLPPAAERTPNWPQDPEAVRAAKVNELNRYHAQEDEARDSGLAGKLARQGRIPAGSVPSSNGPCGMDPDSPNRCDPATYWKNLAVKVAEPDDAHLQPGVEPERKFLTEPPKGFRAPKKVVAATFEKPHDPSEDNAYAYARQQSRAGN